MRRRLKVARARRARTRRGLMIVISNRQDRVQVDGLLVAMMRRAISEGLAAEGISPGAEVSVTLVDDGAMARYNWQYRKVDGPTDVLAFPMMDKSCELGWFELPPVSMAGVPPVLLGDILISVEYAEREARRRGIELAEELVRLVIHGFLHLVGHDHADETGKRQMMERQHELLVRMGWHGTGDDWE